jgi:hypothetical protein
MSFSVASRELLTGYSQLEYLLLGDLRAVLNEPDDLRDTRWLIAILDSLVQTIPKEFELREEGGYLSEVLSIQPQLTRTAELLQAEHARIFGLLADLRRRVGNSISSTALADQLVMELRDWMALLQGHNRRERRVYQSAFNLDVGVGD